MLLAFIAILASGIPPQPQDTVFQVRPGDEVVLEGVSGTLDVRSWNQERAQIRFDTDEEAFLQVRRSGSRLEVRILDDDGRPAEVDLRIRVPSWMNLDVSGRDLEVDIRDLTGEVGVRNLDGDIQLRNLSGRIEASSVQGGIEAWDLRGVSRLKAGHDDVEVRGATGELWVETISGDLELEGLDLRSLEVQTTSGDVDLEGRLLPGGEYVLRTHDGDLNLTLLEPVNANASVLVYDGEFQSDFPVRTQGIQSGQEFRFTLGDGGSRMILETFDGDIEIRRGH